MYTPHTEHEIAAMLERIGVASLDELMRVPEEVALRAPLSLPPALTEREIRSLFETYARRNEAVGYVSFLGAGAYRHYIPSVIPALAMRGEFLTAYTPYQAEVSQGYLQAIYEWQSYICMLTGMEIANASVYDGATALAESVIMAVNATGRRRVLVSRAVHPNYRAVLAAYCDGIDVAIDELPIGDDGRTELTDLDERLADHAHAAVVLQSPNVMGVLDPLPDERGASLAASRTLLIATVAEALSLGVLQPPAAWGAQIVAGEAQSFGIPLAYGGPYAGFIATTAEHLRRIPGRLVGRTVDKDGRTAYVLTLQAREQHIRREKASSNICTNQAHCALIATIYLAAMGATGLRNVAALNLERARELSAAVCSVDGVRLRFSAPFFNEFVVDVGRPAAEVLDALRERRILGGLDLGRFYPEYATSILMTATELTTRDEIAALRSALKEVVRPHVAA